MLWMMSAVNDDEARPAADGEASLLRARLAAIIDTTLDPLILARPVRDSSGDVVDFVIADMNGSHTRAGGDRSTTRRMHLPERSPALFAMYRRVLEAGTTESVRRAWVAAHPDDATSTSGWADIRATGVAGDVVVFWRNVDADVEAEDLLRSQAMRDPLTQLLNRRGVMEFLTAACAAPEPFGVLFVDIDGFKAINDGYGHATGDAVLAATARRLRAVVRDGDVVGRLAGDEFVVLVRQLHDQRELEPMAARLLGDGTEAHPSDAADGPVAVSVSIGALWVPAADHPRDVTAVLHAADTLMYTAKREGGGRLRLGALPDQAPTP
jgi:diguanylate cyclase (GGDEF)-like protein